MENKSNYRIIERDNFYVQKKRKIFGWTYRYNIEEDRVQAPFVITAFVLMILTILTFMKFNFLWYSLPPLSLLLIYIRFSYKYEFYSIEYATNWITAEILNINEKEQERNLKIQKRKTVKIHYLDIKAERRDKLKKIGKV